MDSDRKSTVSSFYGRKDSFGALNADFPPPSRPHYTTHSERARRDSSSSFFDPNRPPRGSADLLNGRSSSAGYNQMSFFDAGRQEPLKGGYDEEENVASGKDAGWDVFADFNNAGPRYSNAFGQSFGQPDVGYRPIPAPAPEPKYEETMSTTGPVELVTVPTLGPEWKASEMKDMTKAGQREKVNESRIQKWKEWNRGERGICGRWFTRRFTVFFMFGLCAIIGIILAFTIPRVPSFAFDSNSPLLPATGTWNSSIPTGFSRAPVNFTFPAFADLQVDTTSNFLPLTFTSLRAQIFDSNTNYLIGTGDLGRKTIPAKQFPIVQMPLNFTYVATNATDPTWTDWYDACKNSALYPNGTRPGVNFHLSLTIGILGLPGSYSALTEIEDAGCPFELSENSA